jgi:fructan beta-fructosidase
MDIALYPDALGYIFSGSAVVDWNNTSGFKSNANDPLVAVFTHHQNFNGLQQQSLAYSTDKGTTWTKYSGNPVLKNPGIADFRDPKVIWFEAQKKWVMVLAAKDRIKIYSSADLKDWSFESDFGSDQGYHGGVWECPDLFPLTDIQGVQKWVLMVSIGGGDSSDPNGGSSTQYFIGDFNGKNFTAENDQVLWADYGIDNYAGVTWSDIPKQDGRRIFLGWMSNWMYAGATPTDRWRGEMTIPREVKLIKSNSKYSLAFSPVSEINTLKDPSQKSTIIKPQNGIELTKNTIIEGGSFIVDMDIDFSASGNFEISMGNDLEQLTINYNKTNSEFVIDRSKSGKVDFHPLFKRAIRCKFTPQTAKIPIQILVDQSSVELFINKGEKAMTALFFQQYKYNFFKVKGDSGKDFLNTFTIAALKKSMAR